MKTRAIFTGFFAWSFLFLYSPALSGQTKGISEDYQEIFGKDYENAMSIVREHLWWADSLEKDGLDPVFAISIIFPELIRYSSISDYIEIKALEVLYVQYGQEYSDFSIGLFQMKPSFAERIEADLLRYQLACKFPSLSALNPDTVNNPDTRRTRVIKLQDEISQLKYLEAFIRVMDHLYPEISTGSAEEKLIFYSTAYNTGYWKGEKMIRRGSDKAFLYTGMIEPEVKYSYAGIALDYYLRIPLRR